ncbi:hypothetical protein U9M48_011022 [Paspalum notatum var. saurae]|uniref:Mitochondrial import inner membrane translocase subunit n=1 Tax=Paspalum notatum var. saurae TaxID=547442 RepID=A0AAQ3SUF7_PASNO
MAAKGGPTNLEKEQMFGMAEKEMEYRVDLFNRLTHTCFDKCIEKRFDYVFPLGPGGCFTSGIKKQNSIWVTNLVGQLLGNRPQM